MSDRPDLQKDLDSKIFRSYYYLKEELTTFCRAEGLPVSGGKKELTERIASYLDGGEIIADKPVARKKSGVGFITDDTPIEPDFVCSQKHRAFFEEKIGKGFSFNVAFQKWLKANTGKTYGQAGRLSNREKEEGRDKYRQFEYNTYIRDFFAENQGKTLKEAIKCWNYKKSMPGHNRYEKADLEALVL
ncbi:MAG: DUF6434 domain-containing protein [Eisenbergiella massiliensis]